MTRRRSGLADSPRFLAQVAVVELPLLQSAFGTASLDYTHWLVCLAMASSVLWFDELRELAIRTLDSRG